MSTADTKSIFYVLGKRYGGLKGLEHDGSMNRNEIIESVFDREDFRRKTSKCRFRIFEMEESPAEVLGLLTRLRLFWTINHYWQLAKSQTSRII